MLRAIAYPSLAAPSRLPGPWGVAVPDRPRYPPSRFSGSFLRVVSPSHFAGRFAESFLRAVAPVSGTFPLCRRNARYPNP